MLDTIALCCVCGTQVQLTDVCVCGEHLLCDVCEVAECRHIARAMRRTMFPGATRRFALINEAHTDTEDLTPVETPLPQALGFLR